MATETVEDLLFRLHLNADEMNQQFVEVSRTLTDNLARINRERNLIDIQTRIDLQGLDRATDATQIFEIRQRSLQRQIENQKARLNLLNAALQDTIQRTGENSDETQRAQIQYEQARLAVRRLETQLQRLNETQAEVAEGAANWTDRINEFIKSGQLVGALDNFQEIFSAINDEMTRLIDRFKEMQNVAYDFNLPFDQAKEFATQIRLAGGELEDVGGFLRGVTDALVKGEIDDPEFIALERYGAEIFDATGRLKSYAEIWNEIAKAYEKAKAEGNEIEFLQMLGGESGVTDAIQALERWKEGIEDAAKVVKSGINPDEMRQAERAINLVAVQFEELHDAIDDLITPAAVEFAENLFEIFRTGTAFIKENKEEIREIGATLKQLSDYMPTNIITGNVFESLKKIFDIDKKSADALTQSVENLNEEVAKGNDKNPLSQYGIQRVNQFRDELEDLKLELKFVDEYKRSLAALDLWRQRELDGKIYLSDDERGVIEELYAAKREKIRRDHAEKIQQIEEESAERTRQLMQETADIQFESTHSAYEKEISDIWNWANQSIAALDKYKDAVRDKNVLIEEAVATAANAMAKETEAFEREIDRIKGKNMSLAEKIFEQEHSRRDVDIMRAQKERAEYYDEGIYSSQMIEHWFKNRLKEIGGNTSADYRKAPKLGTSYYLPSTDFYGDLQAKVDSAMSQADHPAYQLQQYHEAFQQSLTQPVNQFAQSVTDFSELPERFSSAVESLNQATQHYGETAMDYRQPPQITNNISPNITVELGGAYVFDDAMKKQLTDDITEEVANGITSAVQSATSSMNFGYGN